MKKISRRNFSKTVALASSASFFPNILYSQKKKKLGVALLGLGSYSTYQLAPALQLTKYCELKGIITGSPNKIPKWQAKYNISENNTYLYSEMNQIANNDAIDVIYIVTPTGTHAEFSIAAANAGKHVWCEKPMAMNVKECQAIIDTCNKNKVKLTIGYRVQHEPNTLTLNSYSETLPFGKIKSISSMAGYNGGGSGSGWRFQKNMGGGALYDMGVYTVNGMRNALSLEPIRIINAKQYTSRPAAFKEVDETTEYNIEFPDGITGYGKTSVGQSINHLKINCENGWYETRPMQSYSGVKGKRSDGVLLNKNIKNQQAKQMDDDALAILKDQEMPISPVEGLKDIHIIRGIIESAKTGNSVIL